MPLVPVVGASGILYKITCKNMRNGVAAYRIFCEFCWLTIKCDVHFSELSTLILWVQDQLRLMFCGWQ